MKTLLTLLSCSTVVAVAAQSTTWHEIPSGTTKQLNVIEFASPVVGYIGGNDSLLLKTTDGGFTWNQVSYTGVTFFSSGEHIVDLEFVSESVGYMTVGPYSGTYKTTDGGSTWTPINFIGAMCYNYGMYLFSEDNGIFGGAGCFQGEHMEVMTNGTLSEAIINSPSWDATDYILDIDFYDDNYGLAVSKSRFLRTTDGGATWDTIPTSYPDLPITSIKIINDTLAYAGYINVNAGYGLLKTIDAGLTWGSQLDMATFFYPDYNDVIQTQDGHIFTVGKVSNDDSGIIFENFDGLTWWYNLTNDGLRGADSYGDSTVFAVGNNGAIVTNRLPPSAASLEELTAENDQLVIYPNPTQEILTIHAKDGLNLDNSRLLVRNTAGQLVMQTGNNGNTLNVSGLSEGLYFLEVHAEGRHYTSRFVKN